MNPRQSLEQLLKSNTRWPMDYMFKFIVPAHMEKIARVEALFSEWAKIHRKESGKGNYISITAHQSMDSAEEILKIYHKASEIEGIMAL